MTPLPAQQRITPTPPPPLAGISPSASCNGFGGPSGTENNLQCTPQQRPRQQMVPQSAPPPSSRRTQALLASPAALRRSNESLEAIRVAQTLKAGFSRLKARADSQNSSSYSSAPLSQRAFSATSTLPATPARRQLLYRHHSSIAFLRGSPSGASNTLRRTGGTPMSRELGEPVLSPTLRALDPSYSCPQRRQSLREQNGPSLLLPAPRFSLERARSAASSSASALRSPSPSLGCSKRANKEIAEAAETMILFMRDSPSQSEERRAMLRPSDASSSSPAPGSPHIGLSAPQRTSLEHRAADLALLTTSESTPVLRGKDVEGEDEYAPLPPASTAPLPRPPAKRPGLDPSSSSPPGAGPSLPSKRVNIGH